MPWTEPAPSSTANRWKTNEASDPRARRSRRKRHIVTDTAGTMLDGICTRRAFRIATAPQPNRDRHGELSHADKTFCLEIVKRPDHVKGCRLAPRRWKHRANFRMAGPPHQELGSFNRLIRDLAVHRVNLANSPISREPRMSALAAVGSITAWSR